MNKIKLEITSEGWESIVTIDGKEYKEKYAATETGAKVLKVILKAKMVYRKKCTTL